ncbi:hypothetical protein DL93DRAFT_2064238 [Clavulina sp. PMI_390]|nr:hypothetical protein DL93DRAFT_2064238 [Clavulina sp. PMI_390]
MVVLDSGDSSPHNINDGTSENASAAPPRKRARVSKESPKDDSKPHVGRRGMAGKLENIMLMPIDVFAEVAKLLHPFDLLHLSWASKELRAIIMTKNARHMWIGSFKNLPLIPKCPSTMNEPQLAAILFDPVCSNKVETFVFAIQVYIVTAG